MACTSLPAEEKAVVVPPQSRNEADVWRAKAEQALQKFSRAMDFFMFATAQLVRLTDIHKPDDYNHCVCCKAPWPCETALVVRKIGSAWEATQKETNG